MKKIILSLAMTILSLTFIPIQSASANSEKPATTVPAPKLAGEEEARVIISRLNEINSMDKSKLNSFQKKELRKEVKTAKSNLRNISGGVYISGAAVIIIVVLLIILL